MIEKMIRILFVCAGNTCRSPMCEYLFKNMLQEKNKSINNIARNLENSIDVSSCGICVSTPEPANPNTIKAVTSLTQNFEITKHLSKPLTPELIQNSNYIFALDKFVFDYISQTYISQNSNLSSKNLCSKKLFLFDSIGIADPFGSDFESYLETAKTINSALQRIFEKIWKSKIWNSKS